MTASNNTKTDQTPNWSNAPEGWNWLAQDADGKWYWYKTEPVLGVGGGVWKSNSRNQQFAVAGQPNPDWLYTMQTRPQERS